MYFRPRRAAVSMVSKAVRSRKVQACVPSLQPSFSAAASSRAAGGAGDGLFCCGRKPRESTAASADQREEVFMVGMVKERERPRCKEETSRGHVGPEQHSSGANRAVQDLYSAPMTTVLP